jgi:hypothetical protein
MVINAVNCAGGVKRVAVSSEGMRDSDGYDLCTVEVDHVANAQGFGYFVRLQDLGYRDTSFDQATTIGARLHAAWLQKHS